MSDEKQEKQEETAGRPFQWWKKHEGKPVFIQLREGLSWMGVTSPNDPIISQEGGIVSIPFLKGSLIVEGSGEDFRIGVLTADPNPNNRAKMRILLHPDDAPFITIVEQSLIATAG
jgi:hypothetical protein